MRYCFRDDLFGIRALMRLFVLFTTVFMAGCGGSSEESSKESRPAASEESTKKPLHAASDPGSAATSYAKAPFSDRYKYVQSGDQLKNQMAEYYAKLTFPAVESAEIDNIAEVKPGASIVKLTLKRGEITRIVKCYVRQTGDQWLVDWPATIGYNPTPLKTFNSTAVPGQRATFRVVAEIHDYYNYQYMDARRTHYSIRLADNMHEEVAGYVEKSSKIGQELYDLLRDASTHPITVTVRWNGPLGENVDIVSLVSKTWFID